MARVNVPARSPTKVTHEGGRAVHISPYEELRRSVLSCLLWEDTFYEKGVDIATRIHDLSQDVELDKVLALGVEARQHYHLRHAPLWLLLGAFKQHSAAAERDPAHGTALASAVFNTVQRADELAEIVAMYWKDGRRPLPAAMKRGLAKAFDKFDEYQFAKYDRDAAIKLRDVMFLVRPKPKNAEQAALFKRIAERQLATPDTWETKISAAGKDKAKAKAEWERMLSERRMGGLAVLRNLRNMQQAGIDAALIRKGLAEAPVKRVLPFRFLAAAQHAPGFETEIEALMLKAAGQLDKLPGTTILLTDVSGSMVSHSPLSAKSKMSRTDAAIGLNILCREVCEHAYQYAFSTSWGEIPNRRGFGLGDALERVSFFGGGTHLAGALTGIMKRGVKADRIIVLTDEQSHDGSIPCWLERGYVCNVAPYKNGVGYRNGWTHIDGWSERVVDYIREVERA